MSLETIVKMIEVEFKDGEIKQVESKELIKMLQERGFEYEDVDEALDEAERRKIIELDSGFYKWIDPSVREAEKAKTQRYYDMLAEIFEGGKIEFLTEEEVKAALKERGLDDEEAAHILAIAERDFIWISSPIHWALPRSWWRNAAGSLLKNGLVMRMRRRRAIDPLRSGLRRR